MILEEEGVDHQPEQKMTIRKIKHFLILTNEFFIDFVFIILKSTLLGHCTVYTVHGMLKVKDKEYSNQSKNESRSLKLIQDLLKF